jgi:hypothetical protein
MGDPVMDWFEHIVTSLFGLLLVMQVVHMIDPRRLGSEIDASSG